MSLNGVLPVHADTSIGSLPSDNSATGNSYEVFGTDATGPDQDGRIGVCMVAAASGTMTDLDFWVRTDGTPISATMQGEVYSSTGSISDYPILGTGCAGQSTLIATSTNSYDMSTLTSSFVKKSFTFNSGTVVAGGKYMAILYAHFTVYTHAHFFIQKNTGNGNAAMANVDNLCCSPQGSLSQAQNDADEHLCWSVNQTVNQCTAFNAYVSGGGGGGGGSVAYGTLIAMPDGSRVPVQNLEVGQDILMYDVFSGGSTRATIVSMHLVKVGNILTIYTGTSHVPLRVDANPELKFYVLTANGPVLIPVTTLQSGNLLYSYDSGRWVPITSVTVTYGGSHGYYDLGTNPMLNSNGQYLSFIANGIADPCTTGCKEGPTP